MGTTDPAERIDRLEVALSALAEQVATLTSAMGPASAPATVAPTAPVTSAPTPDLPEQFWALRGVHENIPAPGGVVFAGSGTVPGVGVPMVLVSGRLAAERVTGKDPAYRSRAWR